MSRTHYKTLIDTDWLGQWDLIDPATSKLLEATVQIESVKRYKPKAARKARVLDPRTGRETWVDEKNKRLDIAFVGKRKHWLAGPDSQTIIAGLYGIFVEDWIGKRLTLYVDPSVTFGKKVVGGIRPRNAVPGSSVPLTAEALDEPVDEAKAREIEEAMKEAKP